MKNYKGYIRSLLANRKYVLNVFAEGTTQTDPAETPETKTEPQVTTQTEPKPSGTVNYEDLIKKAREDEKAKLYPEIQKLKDSNNNYIIVLGEKEKRIEELEKENESLRKGKDKLSKDLEEGTKTNKTVSQLSAEKSRLERLLEEQQMKHENELNSLKVEAHREKQIAAANGEIIEEAVTGKTIEEVDASIERAKQRYQEIAQRALGNVQMPTVNPSANTKVFADIPIDQIASMSHAEYAEARKKLGLK